MMMCSEEDPTRFPTIPPPFDSFGFSTNDLDEFLLSIDENSSSPDSHLHGLFNNNNNNNNSSSSPDEPITSNSGSPGSGSDSHNHRHRDLTPSIRQAVDQMLTEKRQRRKVSNRESARRSRQRKKWHIDNLNSELTRLTAQNREYRKWLTLALHHCHAARSEHDRLRLESVILRRRLAQLNRARANLVKINMIARSRQPHQQQQEQQQGIGDYCYYPTTATTPPQDDQTSHNNGTNLMTMMMMMMNNTSTTTQNHELLQHLSTNYPYSMV